MKISDIATAYVEYVNVKGGKRRPIFVLEDNQQKLYFYNITSKYKNKSSRIKRQYFKISDLKTAGLKKSSWIDAGHRMSISKPFVKKMVKIGQLSHLDLINLAEFIVHKY